MTQTSALAQLEPLWREALSAPLHAAGCSCCSPPLPPMRAAGLEQDLLDYLEARHGVAVRQRLDAARTANPHLSFAQLLGVVAIDEGLRERLCADIVATLTSITHRSFRTL